MTAGRRPPDDGARRTPGAVDPSLVYEPEPASGRRKAAPTEKRTPGPVPGVVDPSLVYAPEPSPAAQARTERDEDEDAEADRTPGVVPLEAVPDLPEPEPRPEPDPEPEPEPEPEPTPEPTPEPEPAPEPDPLPEPEPEPEPQPEPEPLPVPVPTPDPVPGPPADPDSEPEPLPVPTPKPDSIPTPDPVPEPEPVPKPEPEPEPDPIPTPSPTPPRPTPPPPSPEPPSPEPRPMFKPAPKPTPAPPPAQTMPPVYARPPAEALSGEDAGLRTEAAAPRPERPAKWGRVFWLLIALAAAFLVYDTGRALVQVWTDGWIGGAVLTVLALAFVAALGSATWTEVRALRRLGEVSRFRDQLTRAMADDSDRRLRKALDPVLGLIRDRKPELVKDFQRRSKGLHEPDTIMKQFRGAVLTPLDQEARRTVRANALAVMGATAVAPHPALDVIIVLWRSAVMVRRVAEVYGLRPSPLTTLKLTKEVMVSAAIAVAADPTGDLVATTLGGGLAEKISARFAEGSVSGLRALRLGVRAIEVCRPLPFEPDERKGMWRTLTQG
ncbi:TIGR01620 family protein [Roseospira navarrensis]|uniref:DUF697 domain-containing protein n=1 Tax=Roseospira navarrensis TaxID=140058 RepID=A0A7X1ZD19_9PROT|nr:TIGR01620 family protein [Roseospira navarrensis]MQX34980.1 DUF697 domain-containing protein [Roseospira navarrensis]